MMKYKVGDKVRVRKDLMVNSSYDKTGFIEGMKSFIGKVVTISNVVTFSNANDECYTILEDDGYFAWTDEMLEDTANEAPSITKRINEKHDILNGLNKTDGSGDGEKLVSDSEEAKIKGSHYEKSAMQPLEVMQVIMTDEQFKGFLLGNCIKYCMRKNFKGQHDSDEYKARQYAYWLELADMGQTINPTEDKVPDSYRFKVV